MQVPTESNNFRVWNSFLHGHTAHHWSTVYLNPASRVPGHSCDDKGDDGSRVHAGCDLHGRLFRQPTHFSLSRLRWP